VSRPLLLALRALGLGDFLVAVPAYRALRRAFPEHEFRLATTAGVAPLVALVGGIDSLSTARGPDRFDVPNRRPEVAVNLHGRGPQSRDALRALRPNRLISFRGVGDDDPDAPGWDDSWPGHERARWCHLLGAFGIDADPNDLALRRPGVEPGIRNAVVIHPGAAFCSRQWPAERFAAVARELRGDGHDIVITGSRAEVPLAAAVGAEAGLPRSSVVAGLTDVVSLAALIAQARLVICGDTGPAHLASAYGTASVVLFGPTPPSRWGPPTDARHVALWPTVRRTAPGDPWAAVADPALLAIGARDVIDAARRLLDASRFAAIAIPAPGLW
jgi:ADP-heptose:LPS heptosyltransferase